MSVFSNVPQCEPNTANQIASYFRNDPRSNKVNLAIASYRTDDGTCCKWFCSKLYQIKFFVCFRYSVGFSSSWRHWEIDGLRFDPESRVFADFRFECFQRRSAKIVSWRRKSGSGRKSSNGYSEWVSFQIKLLYNLFLSNNFPVLNYSEKDEMFSTLIRLFLALAL